MARIKTAKANPRKDCVMYTKEKCTGLSEMQCKYGAECRFYKSNEDYCLASNRYVVKRRK